MPSTTAARWAETRSFHHSLYPAARIATECAERGLSVSVCLPARECAETVGQIVGALAELREAGAIDEVVVVDAASADGTAAVAARAGAVVWQEAELMPSYGPVLGKGDAMWRALSVLDGDLVCFLDADTEGFTAHFATGLLGPLVCESGASFVKAFYRRPLSHGVASDANGANPAAGGGHGATEGGNPAANGGDPAANGGDAAGVADTEGGRVNHLTARPALELFYPQLAGVRQPLAGEVAARRVLLERLPFTTGYGVEIGMLIDVWNEVGLDGMAQVDLGEHRHRHQPLSALTPMALTVLATIAVRLQREGRLTAAARDGSVSEAGVETRSPAARRALASIEPPPPAPVERPALASVVLR
jgi:glucosyl-3-phosphoglycerate synthase